MSWRMHIAVCDRQKVEKFRDLQIVENSDVDTVEFYKLVEEDFGVKEDYCIGRLPIKEIGCPFFINANIQSYFEHYTPRILTQPDFINIIEEMRKIIANHYRELLTKDSKFWMAEIADKLDTWEAQYITPYNLTPNLTDITNSNDIEIWIWDVIRLYKTVNWEQDTVIFYGW